MEQWSNGKKKKQFKGPNKRRFYISILQCSNIPILHYSNIPVFEA